LKSSITSRSTVSFQLPSILNYSSWYVAPASSINYILCMLLLSQVIWLACTVVLKILLNVVYVCGYLELGVDNNIAKELRLQATFQLSLNYCIQRFLNFVVNLTVSCLIIWANGRVIEIPVILVLQESRPARISCM
jgi:uncharacterized membrane protein SpoIIM required for sporulation